MTERIEDRNRRVVRRHYDEAWNARDLGSIDETHAADCVHHDPSNPEPIRGLAAIRARLAEVQEAFPDLRMELHDLIAEGDRVVVRWTFTGTHRGTFGGIPATGRPVRVDGIIVHRLRDGRLVEDFLVRDSLAMLRQLGVISLPAPPRG